MQHFTIRDGEIIEAPRVRLGWLFWLSVGLFTILLGFVILIQGPGL
ncbi:hypothetical protein M1M07_23840 [Rhodococcus sp. HM1]|nr:hypothetical protein [Rhodococcus sp. HM1]MCK8674130.1 hypothetical protein [Rhodococcus sp. HM1]